MLGIWWLSAHVVAPLVIDGAVGVVEPASARHDMVPGLVWVQRPGLAQAAALAVHGPLAGCRSKGCQSVGSITRVLKSLDAAASLMSHLRIATNITGAGNCLRLGCARQAG